MNDWKLTETQFPPGHRLSLGQPGTADWKAITLTDAELYALTAFLLPYVQRPILASELNCEPCRNRANDSGALLPDLYEP